MNKIYKVIWSKVRNCYVAVSEIAKRNGKSCTSVNCGAKANRGHAGVRFLQQWEQRCWQACVPCCCRCALHWRRR